MSENPKPHFCKEMAAERFAEFMEDFIFEFRFSKNKKRQELWANPWPEDKDSQYCVIKILNFCPFCGEKLRKKNA